MYYLDIKYSKDIKDKFKKLKIDIKKFENFLLMILNNHKVSRKDWVFELKVKGIKSLGSSYYFGHNEMEVGMHCSSRKKKDRRSYFIQSFLHEFRHFVQDNLDRVSGNKLDYTDKDIQAVNEKYWDNKYEVEAREWEKYAESFLLLLD